MKAKLLSLAGLSMAIMAFAAGGASATTLHVNGVTQNKAVAISASNTAGTTLTLTRTDGFIENTCATSVMAGTTSVYTGTKVTGALSTLTFENCTFEPAVVHQAGQIYIEHESGTTNGNVFLENTEVTFPNSFGLILNCKTGTGTRIGTLTGVASGSATLHINAVLNCGFFLPSATWKGTYAITSPSGLGVSA